MKIGIGNMDESIHPLRVEEIKNISTPFPLFYFGEGDVDYVTQALYVSNVQGINPMQMPQYITLVKELGNGSVTSATYQLVQSSIKGNSNKITSPKDN